MGIILRCLELRYNFMQNKRRFGRKKVLVKLSLRKQIAVGGCIDGSSSVNCINDSLVVPNK